jgi:pyruvate/2-oxoglutarate dehydrogenase complex dihydrolipoamide dehydrogenase (E3) component
MKCTRSAVPLRARLRAPSGLARLSNWFSQGSTEWPAKLPIIGVGRAIEFGERHGLMKAMADAESDRILGCAILGMEGGEIIAVLEIAMMGQLPYTAIRDGIFAHPTWLNL